LSALIDQNATKEGVKPELIRAVIEKESANRPCAISPKGAQGLMQLMPDTAQQFAVADPFDPKQNVEAGTKLLKQLLTKYNGDVSLALSAYNAGSGRVDQEGGIPQIRETINYVADILAKLPKWR
jgi:soluble lytic murein transglycosylase-like protein